MPCCGNCVQSTRSWTLLFFFFFLQTGQMCSTRNYFEIEVLRSFSWMCGHLLWWSILCCEWRFWIPMLIIYQAKSPWMIAHHTSSGRTAATHTNFKSYFTVRKSQSRMKMPHYSIWEMAILSFLLLYETVRVCECVVVDFNFDCLVKCKVFAPHNQMEAVCLAYAAGVVKFNQSQLVVTSVELTAYLRTEYLQLLWVWVCVWIWHNQRRNSVFACFCWTFLCGNNEIKLYLLI